MNLAIRHGRYGVEGHWANFFPSGANASRGPQRAGPFSRTLGETVLRLRATFASLPSAALADPIITAAPARVASEARPLPAVARAQEMADRIVNRMGFPLTALSDVLDVERKTIYDWLKGSEATPANAERLRMLDEVFRGEAEGSLRFFHRFWKRTLPDGQSLHQLLTARDLEPRRIREALDALRPAVEAAIVSGHLRGPAPSDPPSAADLLSGYLEVGPR